MTDKWKSFWRGVAMALGAILTLGLSLLAASRRKTPAAPAPMPADTIVTAADAQKKVIAETIRSDSDQALLDKFNASVKKEKP